MMTKRMMMRSFFRGTGLDKSCTPSTGSCYIVSHNNWYCWYYSNHLHTSIMRYKNRKNQYSTRSTFDQPITVVIQSIQEQYLQLANRRSRAESVLVSSLSSSSSSSSIAMSPATVRTMTTTTTTSVPDTTPYETFRKLLYDNNNYKKAYQFVVATTTTTTTTTTTPPILSDDVPRNMNHDNCNNNTNNNTNDEWKQKAYIELFDALMVQHRTLYDSYNYSFPFPTAATGSGGSGETSTTTTVTTRNITTNNNIETMVMITTEQLEVLQQMISVVEMANNVLECIYPYLGPRYTILENGTIMNTTISSNPAILTTIYNDDDDDDDAEKEEGENDNDKNENDASVDERLNHTGQKQPKKQRRRKPIVVDEDLTNRCNDVLKAWAVTIRAGNRGKVSRSYIRAIPQRAQYLLSRMESTVPVVRDIDDDHGDTDTTQYHGKVLPPSLVSYNSVLVTWAYSSEHLRAAAAQQLFDKLISTKANTPYSNIQPDGDSYKHIIWAWALSRERRAAYIATGHLKKLLRQLEIHLDADDTSSLYEGIPIEPTIDDYHIIAKAWIRSEEKDSPAKALSLVRVMEKMYKKGVTMVQPDLLCYKCVIVAASQRPTLPDLGPLVDETMTLMKDRFIIPDAECYTAAIKTWKNAALLQPDVTPTNQQTSVRRSIELLAEMDIAHNQSMATTITVSTENINDVLEALTVSTHHSRTSMVDELLSKLLQLNTTTEATTSESSSSTPSSSALYVTAESFIYAIRVWSTIESIEKIAQGKTLIWRVKDNYSDLVQQHYNSSNRRKDKIVHIFNEFVHLCGSYRPKSDKDGLQAFGEALDAIRVMRSMDTSLNRGDSSYRYHHKLKPNSSTYAALLQAASNLLVQGGIERRIAVEKIFVMCCEDGMLDDQVLLSFRDIATIDQFATLVEAKSEVIEGMKVVPESWTIHALGGKVKSADGRKTILLGTDGLLKRTMGMKEFHMRRLLDHRNRDLLRGGRWRNPKQKINSCSQTILPPWKLYDSTIFEGSNPES